MSARRLQLRGGPAWPQYAAFLVGVFGLVLGIAGLVAVGLRPFTGPAHERLLVFGLNGLHNVVHVGLGVAGLVASRTLVGSRALGHAVFFGFMAVAVFGMGTYAAPALNHLGVNAPDNTMHVVVALVGLAIAWGPTGRPDDDLLG